MALPGLHEDAVIDFPRPVKESVTVLPFFKGGSTTLSTTAVAEDLVKVSDLVRFENKTFIAEGTETTGSSAAFLTDSTADFEDWGVSVGDTLFNDTDSSSTTITAVTATTLTGVLAGGGSNDWQSAEVYHVNKAVSHGDAEAEEIRKIRMITDLECYIEFEGEASSSRHTVHLLAGESVSEDNVRLISRINIINAVSGETPTVRWFVWGI